MTTIAPGSEERAATDTEHAARVRKAHDSSISRAEGWRLRGPLLPALIVTPVLPAVMTLMPP